MFSKMAMQHTRQAPGRDIHKHSSLVPARSHTITASSKASATATHSPPPHPDPYKTGPKLAKRRRGHHTCRSLLSLPPPLMRAAMQARQGKHSKQPCKRYRANTVTANSKASATGQAAQQPQPAPLSHRKNTHRSFAAPKATPSSVVSDAHRDERGGI